MNLTDHLEKLKYFYEVAKVGSLKKASKTVFISQPSLTKSIKILESVVQKPLFIRLPRGMKLTKEGEILYKYCQKLFSTIIDIESKLTNPEDPFAGSLRIGTYDSIGIYFWPEFLRNFLCKYNKLDIHLTTGRSSEMQAKLDAFELDFILTIDPIQTSNINVKVIKKDTFKLYESSKKNKVYSHIDSAPIILMPTAFTGVNTMKEFLLKNKVKNRKLYTTSSLESVKELTINGLGIGLLPEMVAKRSITQKKIKELKSTSILPLNGIGEHSIGIAYHSFKKESLIIKTLITEISKFKF